MYLAMMAVMGLVFHGFTGVKRVFSATVLVDEVY
jgi:hypothetical protein